MLRLLGARLLDAVPTVFLVLTLVFVAMRLLPGDPALAALGDYATPEQLALFRRADGPRRPALAAISQLPLGHADARFRHSR